MTTTFVGLPPRFRAPEVPARRVETVGAEPAAGRRPLGQRSFDPATARVIARILPSLGKERVEVAAFQSSI